MKSKFKTLFYIAYGVALFLFFVYFTFPYEAVKEKLFGTIKTETGLSIETEKVKPLLLGGPGISFHNATIEGTISDLNYRIAPPLSVENIRIGLSPLSFISLHPAINVGTNVWGGDVSLHAKFNNFFKTPPSNVKFNINKIEINKLANIPLQMDGTISLAGRISGDVKNTKSLSGEISGTVNNIKLSKGTYQGFIIPDIKIKKGAIKGTLADGKFQIEEFHIGTPAEDMHLIIDGNIQLGRRLQFSQADLTMKLKFSESAKNDLKSLLPLIQSALKQDGYYAFMLKGRIGGGGIPLPIPMP